MNAASYVNGELDPVELAEFEAHHGQCAICQAEVESFRSVLKRLRSLPQVESSGDLAPALLARIREEKSETSIVRPWWKIAAMAAVVAILAGGLGVMYRWSQSDSSPVLASSTAVAADPNVGAIEQVDRAIDWLCENQEPNGSWDAAKWGGQERFEVALTALPVIAIVAEENGIERRQAAIDRAVSWLLNQQREDGTFGPEFQGTPYNQSIATLALLRVYERTPEPKLKQSLDRAVQSILRREFSERSTGYYHHAGADRSVSAWQMEALSVADSMGWAGLQPYLEAGRRWLEENASSKSVESSVTSSGAAQLVAASGEIDYCEAFFLTGALRKESDEQSRQQLAAIRERLLARQVTNGAESGSWSPDDRWGRAGGRIYSTALASLSLAAR